MDYFIENSGARNSSLLKKLLGKPMVVHGN